MEDQKINVVVALCLFMLPAWGMNQEQQVAKSKMFFIHIANPRAASFCRKIATSFNSSLERCKQAPDQQEYLQKNQENERLWYLMEDACQKFGARFKIMWMAEDYYEVPEDELGIIIRLAANSEQSIEAVIQHYQESNCPAKIFTDERDLDAHLAICVKKLQHSRSPALELIDRMIETVKKMDAQD